MSRYYVLAALVSAVLLLAGWGMGQRAGELPAARPQLQAAPIVAPAPPAGPQQGLVPGRPAPEDAPAPTVCTAWPFDAAEAGRRQQETARRLGLPVERAVDLGGGAKLELVLIPAGEFLMGGEESPEQVAGKCLDLAVDPTWFQNEHPRHLVRITRPFWMGKYELTQEAWERIMGYNLSNWRSSRIPVDLVDWDDCQKFLEKLNAQGQGAFRLPTEAEWEYACRAGTATAFHFGETLSADQANYDSRHVYGSGRQGDYRGKKIAVGSFPANAWGLHDMHGNGFEWCADWYAADYYARSPKADPAGPDTGGARVLRGGSWGTNPGYCRSALRYLRNPSERGDCIGFRVVSIITGG